MKLIRCTSRQGNARRTKTTCRCFELDNCNSIQQTQLWVKIYLLEALGLVISKVSEAPISPFVWSMMSIPCVKDRKPQSTIVGTIKYRFSVVSRSPTVGLFSWQHGLGLTTQLGASASELVIGEKDIANRDWLEISAPRTTVKAKVDETRVEVTAPEVSTRLTQKPDDIVGMMEYLSRRLSMSKRA